MITSSCLHTNHNTKARRATKGGCRKTTAGAKTPNGWRPRRLGDKEEAREGVPNKVREHGQP